MQHTNTAKWITATTLKVFVNTPLSNIYSMQSQNLWLKLVRTVYKQQKTINISG